MKNKIMWITLVMLIAIACITTYTTYIKVTGVMEHQQNKIEALQTENGSLHDDVWTLSNRLMKSE